MPKNDNFKQLLATWKAAVTPSSLVTYDVFYLSTWVRMLDRAQEVFFEELEDNLLEMQEVEENKYFTYLFAKLTELLEPLAKLSTAAPTNLLAAFNEGRPFKHTAFYHEVLAALNKSSRSSATPPYDEEDAARPFQNEYVQASFLAVHARIQEAAQPLSSQPLATPELLAGAPPLKLKVDIVDLLDLFEIMLARGDWEQNPKVSRKVLCQRITALFELPASKKGSKKSDAERLYYLMGEREKDKSKTLTNSSKKGLYDKIKPNEKNKDSFLVE